MKLRDVSILEQFFEDQGVGFFSLTPKHHEDDNLELIDGHRGFVGRQRPFIRLRQICETIFVLGRLPGWSIASRS